jgi:hypothetical protein
MLRLSLCWKFNMMIPVSDRDAQTFFVQLNNAITKQDRKAIARTMRDLAELGYYIQIMTRHVARNGDRLEITSTLSESRMTVNGMRHIPTIVKYQGILERLDTHPEEYDAYFNHKNELSPEDNEWMRIDPSQGDRFDDSKYR